METFSGYIALLGRPNVGKSTLLNRFIGEKISITANKPQTTRHRMLGIETLEQHQFIFVDTPGLHRGVKKKLNRYMNRVAQSVMHDVDVILWLVEALKWHEDDEWIAKQLASCERPIILAINKIDLVKDKSLLLPFIESIKDKVAVTEIFPISAETGFNLDNLHAILKANLQPGPFYFPPEQMTDRNTLFRLSEIVREKLTRFFFKEVPYALSVEIEHFELKKEKEMYLIHALIWVEHLGQKRIIIGNKGEALKRVGIQSREDMEKLLGKKVCLKLWVKVKEGWSEDESWLYRLGYNEE